MQNRCQRSLLVVTVEEFWPLQHGIDRHREKSQISEPLVSAAFEDLSNLLHLIGREGILLPKLNAFVPCPPFGRALFRHSFPLR